MSVYLVKILPFIIFSVGLNSFAQLFLRKAMLLANQGFDGAITFKYIISLCLNIYLILGMSCYAISIFLWLYVLSKVNVSIAYPMGSLGYIFAMFAAFFTLGEPLSIQKILGTLIICLGVFVLSLSPDV